MKTNARKWLVVFSGFIFFFMIYGLVSNCFSIYIVPVTADLGFTRGQFSIAQTMIFLGFVVCALTAPKIYKKVDLVTCVKISVIVCALAYFLESFVSNLWLFYILSFIEGYCMNMTTTMPTAILVREWFDTGSNKAMGMASLGTGLGGAALNLIVNKLITTSGWRMAFRIMGPVCFLVTAIPAFILIKRHPEALAKEQEKRRSEVTETKVKKEKQPVYKLAYGFGFISIFMNIAGCIVMYTLVPYLQDIGQTPAFAAAVSSGSMLVLAAGKFIYGALLDKFGIKKCYAFSQICAVIGIVTLVCFKSKAMVVIYYFSIIGACCFGAVGTPAAANYFSDQINRNETLGMVLAIGQVGSTLAGTICGLAFDLAGSYVPLFIVWGVLMVVLVPIANILFNKRAKQLANQQ